MIRRLKNICIDFHWMARRYADMRSSYVVYSFNKDVRELLKLGIKLNATGDKILWARDYAGRVYDGLTNEEATPETKKSMGES